MSASSLNHVYLKVDDAVTDINERTDSPLHRAFAEHLTLVSDALYELERWLSGETSKDTDASIRACLPADAELRQAIADAEKARDELAKVLRMAKDAAWVDAATPTLRRDCCRDREDE